MSRLYVIIRELTHKLAGLMKKYDMSFAVAFTKAVFAWVLLGLIGTSSLRAQNTPLNDSNFNTARDLWFSDQASAIATYGHIKDWNVTGVTRTSRRGT